MAASYCSLLLKMTKRKGSAVVAALVFAPVLLVLFWGLAILPGDVKQRRTVQQFTESFHATSEFLRVTGGYGKADVKCYKPVSGDTVCVPPENAMQQSKNYETENPRVRHDFLSEEKLHEFNSRCLPSEPFAPIITQHRSTTYKVCQPLVVTRQDLSTPEDYMHTTEYYPGDTPESLPDAEILSFLMSLSLDDPSSKGLSADVGVGTGSTAFPLLSLGHEVHLFEHKGDKFKWIVEMTLKANGWSQKAHLHEYATRFGPHSIDTVFKDHGALDLMKISVNDPLRYDEILAGALATLEKTTCVELKLLSNEIGTDGMLKMAGAMDAHGFDMYLIHGEDHYGRVHHSIASPTSVALHIMHICVSALPDSDDCKTCYPDSLPKLGQGLHDETHGPQDFYNQDAGSPTCLGCYDKLKTCFKNNNNGQVVTCHPEPKP